MGLYERGIDNIIRTTAIPQSLIELANYEYCKTESGRMVFKKKDVYYYFKKVHNNNNFQDALRLTGTIKEDNYKKTMMEE